jgi:predicted enzyme related to lactoylglutathione lyase
MKNTAGLFFLAFLISGCDNSTEINTDNKPDKTDPKTTVIKDTTPRVTGIGGVFFFSDDPEKTRGWYNKNLGLDTNGYGSVFESRNANDPDEINYLQWSPFKTGNKYFAPSKKDFMINYRVKNIEGLVKKLKENGVTIVDSIETYDYGKFIHIMDPDGNKIELWEPIDSTLTNTEDKTTN